MRLLNVTYVVTGLFLIAAIILGYLFSWEWVGVSTIEYAKQSNQEITPLKTLWDWMQLLIIPLALVIGGYFLNRTEKRREEEAAKERANLDREIAQKQREVDIKIAALRNEDRVLSEYLDRMSELILEKNLLNSAPKDPIRNVARTRTITVLQRLTRDRVTTVVNFLKESQLISSNNNELREEIVSLKFADLSNVDYTGVNLSDMHLQNVIFNGAILESAFLFRTKLEGANFERANLERADLTEANLKEAKLMEAKLNGARFGWADLSKVNFKGAHIKGTSFYEAILTNADFHEATIEGINFSFARLTGVNLSEANLKGAQIKEAQLPQANLKKANLEGADLFWSSFSGANLSMANLKGANLNLADLPETNLEEANLEGVNFNEANLTKTNFKNALGLKKDQLTNAFCFDEMPYNLPDAIDPPTLRTL